MKKLILLLILGLFLGQYALAQELTPEEKKKVEEKYFGNKAYYFGVQNINQGKTGEARTLLLKASDEFKIEAKWLGFVRANQNLVRSFRFGREFKAGLERGEFTLEILEDAGDDANKFSFHIYRELARIYARQEKFEKALNYHFKEKKILETYWMGEEYEGEYPFYYGSVYNDIGSVYIQKEELEKGKEYYLQAIEIGKIGKNCDLCKAMMANASTNLGGNYYRDKGMMIEAIDHIEQGIDWFEEAKGQNDLGLVAQYLNIIYLYDELSEWEKSSEYYKKIIYIIEASGTKEDRYIQFHLPNALYSVSMRQAINKDYEDARSNAAKLIAHVGDNVYLQPYQVKALITYAKIAHDKDQFKESEQYLLEADSLNNHLREISNGQAEDSQLEIYLNLSNLWGKQKDYDKAIIYRQKAIKLPGIENSEKYRASNDLSDMYLLKGKLDSAEIYNRQVLKRFARRFRPKSFYELPKLEQLREGASVYKTLSIKSFIANEKAKNSNRPAEKDSLFALALEAIELADSYYKSSLKKMNLLRGASSKGVFGMQTRVLQYGLNSIYDQYQYYQDDALFDKALYLIQQIKSQKLTLSLLNEEALSFGKLPKELMLKERDLLAKIQEYERDLRKAKRKKNDVLIDTLENVLLFNTKKEYKELLIEMEQNYPSYYEAKFNFRFETIESLSQLLKEDELLIEYVINRGQLQILLIESNGQAEFIATPIMDGLKSGKLEVLDILVNSSVMRKSKRTKFIQDSHKLYQQLIKPIENRLQGKKKLIILPSAWFYYLPFEVLLASDEVKPLKDLDFLIKDFDISYHYSSNLFAKARRSQQSVNKGIYAFAPVYDNQEKVVSSHPNSSTLRATDGNGKFSPLPESEKEVKAIESLFKKNKKRVKVDLKGAATEGQLKQELEQDYRFIHIAGHSFADTKNPNFSGIACYPSKNEDGILYNGEINYLNMQADLISLSSCESGFGKLNYNEGLLGLNRSFMYAGTPNVVFSLWKVYDKVSSKLMVEFYKEVLDGKSYSESLRNAKLELLKKESTANPHFWAPFLLIGR